MDSSKQDSSRPNWAAATEQAAVKDGRREPTIKVWQARTAGDAKSPNNGNDGGSGGGGGGGGGRSGGDSGNGGGPYPPLFT